MISRMISSIARWGNPFVIAEAQGRINAGKDVVCPEALCGRPQLRGRRR